MAIIYSYPDNLNILLTDMLIGTSTIKVAGKKKNITKNFTVEALGKVISTANPTVWGTIIGSLDDQTDLQAALDSKQNNITLTTIGSNGPSTLIGSVLNIPNYFTVVPTKTSELINDGEDGIHPFITLADIPPSTIPNLNDVLLEGNISELDAKIGELYLYDGPNVDYAKISIQDDFFSVSRATSGTSMVSVDNGYSLTMNNGAANASIINPLTTSRTYTLPDASGTIALTSDIPAQGLTSVGLSMPVAFNVSNSPLTSDGTIAVSAAGTSSQYIRGDGQLATLPTGAGGGSTVAYYLNGSINASVAGYKQLSNTAIIGGGTDFSLTGNGLITQFLTDIGNPNRIEIPGGAWNFEMWFSMSSNGGTPKFYVELLKYDGTTFTTIANSSAAPETIDSGTVIDLYLTSLAVPTTTLLVTDRLAITVYIVDNSGGRTATLHTEDNHLCEIITTFSGGVTSLNGLTANTQYLAVGTTGTDFNINSLVDTHTFNLPTASATNRGALSTTDWTTFNEKFTLPSLTSGSVLFSDGTTIAQDNSNFFWDNTNNRLGIGTNAPAVTFDVTGIARITNGARFNNVGIAYGPWGQNPLEIGTNGSHFIIQATNGGNTSFGSTVNLGAKVGIKAPGALSTDIALRVRNSADSFDIIKANGRGDVFIGQGAGNVTTGADNVFIGNSSGLINTSGVQNTFIGSNSGKNNISANDNVGFGANSLSLNRGNSNNAFGTNTLQSNINATINSAFGNYSMQFSTLGSLNLAVGQESLKNMNGSQNTSIGTKSGQLLADKVTNLTLCDNSVFLGYRTSPLANNQTNQIVIGFDANGIGSNTVVLGNDSITKTALKGNILINTTTDNGGKLQIKAGGALSTDIALRVRNSADTANLLSLDGTGNIVLSNGFYGAYGSFSDLNANRFNSTFTNPSTYLGIYRYSATISSTSNQNIINLLPTYNQASGTASNTDIFLNRTTTAAGSGTQLLMDLQHNSISQFRVGANGNTLIGTTTDNGGKLQIKAGGALSTDIALRVRNSADTADLIFIDGIGNINFRNTDNGSFIKNNLGTYIELYNTSTGNMNFNTSYFVGNYVFRNQGIERMRLTASGSLGVGTTAPVASAKVQIDSTTQGFLPPRMTNAQRIAIATPAIGLMVYCTDTIEGLYINKSTGWTFII